jgi:VanZ family protein
MKHKKAALTVLYILDILWVLFIFGRSMKPAPESSLESDWILNLVHIFIPSATEHFVRKLAHFTEFGILGLLVSLTESMRSSESRVIAAGSLFGLAVAICDELIQLTSPGRSCQISDMLLDFSGALAASLFVWALLWLIRKNRADADHI